MGRDARSDPLVGRDREIALVRSLAAGEGFLCLAGDPGMGKTRLARMAAEYARAAHRLVIVGEAQPFDEDLPLAVFRDALREFRRHHRGSDLGTTTFARAVLPEIRGGSDAEAPARDVVFEAATRWLGDLSDQGVLLVLEDLHWADPTSLNLVVHLARTAAGDGTSILATFRPHEVEADSSLHRMRLDLARGRLAQEILLEPLGRAEIDALVRARAAGDLDEAVVSSIGGRSGGNPFIAEELVAAELSSANVSPATSEPGMHALPWTVSEMILSRLRPLPEEEMEILRWGAVAGEAFRADVVTGATGWTDAQVLGCLTHLGDRGLLRETGTGQAAFRHALTREALLGAIPAPERSRRHAALLAAGRDLARRGRDIDTGWLLTQAIGANDRGAIVDHSAQAADEAIRVGGDLEALTHTARALTLLADDPHDPRRAELLVQRGRLGLRAGSDWETAVDDLVQAATLLRQAGDPDRAVLASTLALSTRWMSGDPTVLDDMRAAPAALTGAAPDDVRLEVMASLARPLMLAGDHDAAVRIATDALSLVPQSMSRQTASTRRDLAITLATARASQGSREDGERTLRDLAPRCVAEDDPVAACRAYRNLTGLVADADEVGGFAVEGLRIARRYGLRHAEQWFLVTTAWTALERGDLAAARDHIDEANPIDVPATPFAGLPEIEARMALARGDFADARRRYRQLVAAAGDTSEATRAECHLAETLALLGELDDARATAASALARTDDQAGLDRIQALAVTAIVSAWAAAGSAAEDAADRLPPEGEDDWGGAWKTIATGINLALGGDTDAAAATLEDGARRLTSKGLVLDANSARLAGADAIARTDATHAVALARRALAEFRAMGATAWCEKCEDVLRRAGTPVPRPRAATNRRGLTTREQEVLSLLADGASNRTIAEALVISPHTVNRHITSIFAKLGVHTRSQAVRLALDEDLAGRTSPFR